MQIDFERVGEHHNFEDRKWVLLQLGSDENSVIQHGSGVTVKSIDRTLTTEAVGLAETHARYLGLYKFYWSGPDA